MKNKLMAIILGLTIVLTSCGASQSNTARPQSNESIKSDFATSEESFSEEVIVKNNPVTAGDIDNINTDMPRKLVKNGNMTLETKEFDEGLTYLLTLIEENGGYIQSQSTHNSSLYNKNERFCRNATIIARIPAENFESTEDIISQKFNITYKNDYIDDITDDYYDAQAHLDTLKAQEKKLLELLDKAEDLSDVIELEQALAECRANIDSFTGRLKRMDNQVAFSTVNITLNEVIEYNDSYNTPLTFTEKLKNSFAYSGRHLKNFFSGLLFFIIEDLPVVIIQIALIALIVWAIVIIIKKIRKSMHKKSNNNSEKLEISENNDTKEK